MAATDVATIMGNLNPTKSGLRFIGGNVDDQIQINASGATMANSFLYGTIAAWICVPDETGTYTIISYGDDNIIEYITLDVVAGTLRAICCDNTAVQWSFVTTNKVIKAHKWHHIAVVQDGVIPKLYVDGAEVTAITRTTETLNSAWFKACAGIDAGSIGAFEGTGDASLTQEFKGYIADVQVYGSATTTTNTALTADQIKIIKSGGSITGVFNRWVLDNDVLDDGSGADDGTIVGDIIHCEANEFISKLTFRYAMDGTVASKDLVQCSISENKGFALILPGN